MPKPIQLFIKVFHGGSALSSCSSFFEEGHSHPNLLNRLLTSCQLPCLMYFHTQDVFYFICPPPHQSASASSFHKPCPSSLSVHNSVRFDMTKLFLFLSHDAVYQSVLFGGHFVEYQYPHFFIPCYLQKLFVVFQFGMFIFACIIEYVCIYILCMCFLLSVPYAQIFHIAFDLKVQKVFYKTT